MTNQVLADRLWGRIKHLCVPSVTISLGQVNALNVQMLDRTMSVCALMQGQKGASGEDIGSERCRSSAGMMVDRAEKQQPLSCLWGS